VVAVLFQTVFDLAVAMERAEKECLVKARRFDSSGEPVNAIQSKPGSARGKRKWKGKCTRCGRVDHHSPKECPCRNFTCHQCGEKGHLRVMCGEQDNSGSESADEGSTKKDTKSTKGGSRKGKSGSVYGVLGYNEEYDDGPM